MEFRWTGYLNDVSLKHTFFQNLVKILISVRSHGLVVQGEGLLPRGRGFESWRWTPN